MKLYLVGGALRDALLGQPVNDKDWLVVGATPKEMIDSGFIQVGQDFPVFLHPKTKEEYALARTERKSAPGYRGFVVHSSPSVTLEEDLSRRDLTINAMAFAVHPASSIQNEASFNTLNKKEPSIKSDQIIDPFNGLYDLQQQVLRHVTDAFREDPVRILRIARFSAQFPNFSIAAETKNLLKEMVEAGEIHSLVCERVWQEIARGLMQPQPSRMFEVLRECGALKQLMPEVDALWGVPQAAKHHPEIDCGTHTMMALDYAAKSNFVLAVRYAVLCHDLGKAQTPPESLPHHPQHEGRSALLATTLSNRLKAPTLCRELAVLFSKEHGAIHASQAFNATQLLQLFQRCDALRNPNRFTLLLEAGLCDARGRLQFELCAYPQLERLSTALTLIRSIPTSKLASEAAAKGLSGKAVGTYIDEARLALLSQAIESTLK